MFALRHAWLAAVLLWPAVAPAAAAAPTDAPPDWAQAVKDWTVRAELGDAAAPKQLCELHFDGRGGAFDAVATLSWCQRAAALGDAAATQRLGLLSLAGIGTRRDLDAAAALCAQASTPDAAVSAGFCLAAVAEERRRGGAPAGATAPPIPPGSDAASPATVSQWRDRAAHGDRTAPAHLCEYYFGARGGAFGPARAAEWCRRAARDGDAAAMRRLGLMRLWGIGMDKSTPHAEALCLAAQARDPAVSAAFCSAAIGQERVRAAAAAAPSRVADAAPRPGIPERTLAGDALAQDRAVESVRATDTGLQFNCRDILRWSRYESREGLGVLTPEARAFGRAIIDYREQDYAALDRAAVECSAAIAPFDTDGSDRRHLAEFRGMLPLIKARQAELERQRQARRDDVPRCVEAMRRSRAVAQRLAPVTGPIDPRSADVFSCTSAGSSQPILADTPLPAQPQRPAAGGR